MRQSFHFQKIPGGLNINKMKNDKKLSFTIKNKRRKQIQNSSFKNYNFGPPKKRVFGFKEKPIQNFFSSCFGFDSALKTIDAQMSFWSVFLKTHFKKAISRQKRRFGRFFFFSAF